MQGEGHWIPPAQQRSCWRVFLTDWQPLYGSSPLGYVQIPALFKIRHSVTIWIVMFNGSNWATCSKECTHNYHTTLQFFSVVQSILALTAHLFDLFFWAHNFVLVQCSHLCFHQQQTAFACDKVLKRITCPAPADKHSGTFSN